MDFQRRRRFAVAGRERTGNLAFFAALRGRAVLTGRFRTGERGGVRRSDAVAMRRR